MRDRDIVLVSRGILWKLGAKAHLLFRLLFLECVRDSRIEVSDRLNGGIKGLAFAFIGNLIRFFGGPQRP